MLNTIQRISLAALFCLALTVPGRAASIGYWQFDDQPADTNASTLASEVNSPDADGTASAHNDGATGALPIHRSDTPGLKITDGDGGAILNAINTTSLEFLHAGDENNKSGSLVTVQDPVSNDNLLEPAGDFTVEGFVKIQNHVNFATLIGKERSGGTSWEIDTSNNGTLRLRADTQDGVGGGTHNDGLTSSFNLEDGQWHHFALTYDSSERRVSLFGDYVQTASTILGNGGTIMFDDSPIRIGTLSGGRSLDGWLDELRYSDTLLTSDQFLRAIPTPAALPAGLALIGLIGVRRRRDG